MIREFNPSWGARIQAGLLIALAAAPAARAELVFDEDTQAVAQNAESGARANEREATREVLGSADRAQVSQAAVAVPAAVSAAPVAAPAAPAPEVEHLSRAELLRRARLREELKNEDLLQERLEQLRLRDEQKRTGELAAGNATAMNPQLGSAPTAVPVGASAAMIPTETVVAPVTVRPGEPAARPMSEAITVAQAAPMPMSGVSMAADSIDPEAAKTVLTVAPRLGVAGMQGDAFVDVQSRFTTGLTLGAEISDHLSMELGYSYSEFGVTPFFGSPAFQLARAGTGGFFGANNANYLLRQNLIDGGVKLHVMGRDSMVRPYVTGGGGYVQSSMNLDPMIIGQLQMLGLAPFGVVTNDYSFSGVTGYLGAGIDLRLSKGVSVGVGGKYSTILSARENQRLFNQMFWLNQETLTQQVAGASLARSAFYLINASVTFAF